MKKNIIAASLATTAFLAACGGGGGDASNADPQGFWSGPANTGYTVNAVILDTGEVWGIYSNVQYIYGALFGNASVNGQSITVRGTDFNFEDNTATAGTLTGTVVPKISIQLASRGGLEASLTYGAAYDTPATAEAIAGTWSFIGRSSTDDLAPGSVTVNGSGAFTLSQTGCTTLGNIVPRPGGKNIYNVTLNSSGGSCAVESSLSGVAYLDTSSSPNRFLALGLTLNKEDGLIIIGTRSPS